MGYLNTSHVKVNHNLYMIIKHFYYNLNTSHVKVNLNITHVILLLIHLFKYISC